MARAPAKKRTVTPKAKQAPRRRAPREAKATLPAQVNVPLIATIGTMALGAGLAVIGYALMRHADENEIRPGSGARRHDEGDIRHAGPDSMRTQTQRSWEKTDQASDESFPASDPPATY